MVGGRGRDGGAPLVGNKPLMFIAVLASLMLSYTYFISMSALKDELTQVTASFDALTEKHENTIRQEESSRRDLIKRLSDCTKQSKEDSEHHTTQLAAKQTEIDGLKTHNTELMKMQASSAATTTIARPS
jgi:hypothetical protein